MFLSQQLGIAVCPAKCFVQTHKCVCNLCVEVKTHKIICVLLLLKYTDNHLLICVFCTHPCSIHISHTTHYTHTHINLCCCCQFSSINSRRTQTSNIHTRPTEKPLIWQQLNAHYCIQHTKSPISLSTYKMQF